MKSSRPRRCRRVLVASAIIGASVVNPFTSNAAFAAPSGITAATIRIGEPTEDVAVNEGSGVIWAALLRSDRVARVSPDGSIKYITVRGGPIGVELDSKRNLLYVTTLFDSEIVVIDGKGGRVLGSFDVSDGHSFATSIDENSGRAYIPSGGGIEVVGGSSSHYTIHRDGGIAYGSSDIDLDPNSGILYVTRPQKDEILLLQNGDILRVIQVPGTDISDVAVDPSDGTAYVSDQSNGTVMVVKDGSVDSAIVLPIGAKPADIAVNRSTGSVFVVDQASNSVHEIEAGKVVATYGVGAQPRQVQIDETANTTWVRTQTGITAVHNKAVSTQPVRCPHFLDLDEVRHTAVVSDFCGPDLHVFQHTP